MKKQTISRFFPAIVCLLFLHTGYSQSIRIGLQGGVLIANIDHEPKQADDPQYKSLVRPQISIPIEIGFGEIFAIQPEIMFGVQGTGLSEHGSATIFGITSESNGTATRWANFLEIPLLGKLKFGPENFKIHFLAGPSVGFGLKGKSNTEVTTRVTGSDGTVLSEGTVTEKLDAKFLKDGYDSSELDGNKEFAVARTNFNVHAGTGLNFNAGSVTCFLEGRYILGLSDLTPDQKDSPDAEKQTNKSRRIGISAGLLFPLK